MMISIWGKNGSGKSTLASNLAGAFAKRGYQTALVGSNRFYGAIQHYFNMEIRTDQSMRTLLTGGDSLSIHDYFIECPYEKKIHIASLADRDDYAGYRKMRVDMAVRFLNLVSKNYPVTLIDCDESTDDPLSMYSLTMSDKIAYVARPALQSVIFAKAYESIVAGLQIKEKINVIYVAGAAGSPSSAETGLFAPFGITASGYRVLPYCKEIERPRENSTPIVFSHGDSRAAARYRKVILAIADSYLSGCKIGRDINNANE